MRTKKVEMAVRDPKTKKSVVDEVEVQVVTVNVRNRDLRQRGGHVYTSLVSDMTLQISDTEAAEIKRRRNGAWELVTTAPTALADDEEAPEATSSQASAASAAAEALLDDDVTPTKRVPRVQRRR
jgi:hypothetical protein